MKIRTAIVSSLLAIGLGFSVPAFAQTVNPNAEASWQRFLVNHPGATQGLANNPSGYLNTHKGAATWLRDHPAVAAQARANGQIGGGAYGRNGWYGRNNGYYGNGYYGNGYGNPYYGNRYYGNGYGNQYYGNGYYGNDHRWVRNDRDFDDRDFGNAAMRDRAWHERERDRDHAWHEREHDRNRAWHDHDRDDNHGWHKRNH